MHSTTSKLATLLGTASLLTMANALTAQAQQQVAQAQMAQENPEAVPENVLITGSLIHGTVAVGVPITQLKAEDYAEVGALTTADLLKDVASIYVLPSVNVIVTGGNFILAQDTRIHNIGGDPTGPKTMLMIDGKRVPFTSTALCLVDPSLIPQLAVDHLDVLADGASATYGADAVAGVINITLKRGFDGAISQVRIGEATDFAGGLQVMASQQFGRTWDGGDVTATYEYYHDAKVQGPGSKYFTYNFAPFGLDNRTPIVSALPGIATVGKPTQPMSAPAAFDPNTGTTCNNCYSIPKGQNGVGLTWAQIVANPGVGNEYNPYKDAWIFPDQQRNAAVITFDQDVYKSDGLLQRAQFYAEGFYNNRRVIQHSPGNAGPTKTDALSQAIPTTNPYYPIGAPPGLRVAYNLAEELNSYGDSGVQQGRWEGGFNLELPFDWKGKISYASTEDHAYDHFVGNVNPNLVNAALGNVTPGSGQFASYTKPANIPYLNLFCDPNAFTCNDPATLAYITGDRIRETRQRYNEANTTFDGPVFDLPAGQPLRAAIGVDYLTEHSTRVEIDGTSSLLGNAAPGQNRTAGALALWAVFGQVNIPIVGEANSIPLVRALEVELSGRIDHYSNFGYTKNPKIALNWNVGAGLTLRGTAGTSFRAPLFTEINGVGGGAPAPTNIAAGATSNTTPTCPVVGVPAVKGSAAAILDPNCTAALQFLGILPAGFGVGHALDTPGDVFHLNPETARNWSVGFDFAPTDYLKGIDLNFTLYNIKIYDAITSLPVGGGLDDPVTYASGYYILPQNNPNFAQFVKNIASLPNASALINQAGIQVITDGRRKNLGSILYRGIDFSGSYVWDMGDWGAWNTGITGNYILDRRIATVVGAPILDDYNGKDSGGKLNYRARLGWAGGPNAAWSVTAFMNWHAHIGTQEAGDSQRPGVLPPTCFLMGQTPCNASGLPQFAQYTNQYATLNLDEPAFVTFDLSLGFKTGDRPANDLLKNLSFQFVANNFLNRKPNFTYYVTTAAAFAFNQRGDPSGRVISFTITKAW
jgi:iron complex outermembrane receptor protein